MKSIRVMRGGLMAAAVAVLFGGCGRQGSSEKKAGAGGAGTGAVHSEAAAKTFVAPGQKDEFYLFYSGGHSGQVFIAGIPSMRHLFTIPVFSPHPGVGYGFDEETKHMLGGFT